MLYLMVFAPFLAAFLMFAASGKDSRSASRLAVILSSALFVASIALLVSGDYAMPIEWFRIPVVDDPVVLNFATNPFPFATNGFASWMVFLASIITLAALIASRNTPGVNYRNFAIGMFVQLGALNGTFLAVDAVVFFFFFEALVLPAAFLIGSYGGPGKRPAALHFALYTLIGSAPMAVALWYLISLGGSSHMFLIAKEAQNLSETTQTVLFWCFVLAFWVKTPLFPLHGWLAETYAEAPAGLSAVLTGSMSKAGVYGFFWCIAIFPAVAFENAKLLMGLGLFTAVYGALMAMRAKDIKKLLAFSSMGHLGLAVAGIFTLFAEMFPVVLVMLVGHGLSAAALFILSGSAERFAGSRLLSKMGGYARLHPVFAFFFGVACVLAIAIPGTVGFVGEFLVLFCLWNASKIAAIVASVVIVLSAVYMLRLIRQVLFGECPETETSGECTQARFPALEAVATAPLLILLIFFGIHPAPIMGTLEYSNDEDALRTEEIEAAIAAAIPAEPENSEVASEVALDTILKQEMVVGKDSVETVVLEAKQVEDENVR